MLRQGPIDVVIVEDHIAFRDALEFFLVQSHDLRCRCFTTVPEAIEGIWAREPHIVIMDIHLPGENGIVGTRLIKQHWPHVHVLICTVHEDDEKIFNALRAGASGYLLKRTPLEQLVQGIHHALEGGSPISPAIARRVVNSFQQPPADGVEDLTAREREVLDLLSTGMRVKAIATKLCVSESTIRTHVHHIYEKLQVQGRAEMMGKMRGK